MLAITYYNLKAVVQMTGIPAASLRAWEKRYGLPTPIRKANGHRVYPSLEVTRLLRVKALLASGISISQATTQVGEVGDLGDESPERSVGHRLHNELLEALNSYDTRRANQLFAELFDLLTVEQLCLRIVRPLLPGLAPFGRTYLRSKLGALLVNAGSRATDPVALVMAPDPFRLEPLLAAVFLSRRGYQVRYIEGDEGPTDLQPALVIDPRQWVDSTPPEQLFQPMG